MTGSQNSLTMFWMGGRWSQSGWRWATNFVFKDPAKGNTVDNYRPVSCQPHMWKLSTTVVSESKYNYLDKNKLLPEEQKVCRKGSKREKKLLSNTMILQDC